MATKKPTPPPEREPHGISPLTGQPFVVHTSPPPPPKNYDGGPYDFPDVRMLHRMQEAINRLEGRVAELEKRDR